MTEREKGFAMNGLRAFMIARQPDLGTDWLLKAAERLGISVLVLEETRIETNEFVREVRAATR